MSNQITTEAAVQATEQIATAVPPVDIYETEDSFVVVADVPGVGQEHIDLKVENNTLTIEATTESRPDRPQQSRGYDRIKFARSFTLGRNIDAERIEAGLNHGVLRVRLPKTAQAQPRKIDVRVNN